MCLEFSDLIKTKWITVESNIIRLISICEYPCWHLHLPPHLNSLIFTYSIRICRMVWNDRKKTALDKYYTIKRRIIFCCACTSNIHQSSTNLNRVNDDVHMQYILKYIQVQYSKVIQIWYIYLGMYIYFTFMILCIGILLKISCSKTKQIYFLIDVYSH